MLLRRLNQHVRNQNWFAVGLDLLIVIVGVYIGLQVQQWSNDRERQQREAKYLERLHEEVLRTSELRAENVALRHTTMSNLEVAHEYLIGEEVSGNPGSSACLAIAMIAVMSNVTPDLPTVAELFSAGQSNISRVDSDTRQCRIDGLRHRVLGPGMLLDRNARER